jgi:hypothetical protein
MAVSFDMVFFGVGFLLEAWAFYLREPVARLEGVHTGCGVRVTSCRSFS